MLVALIVTLVILAARRAPAPVERLPIPASWPTLPLSLADRAKRLIPMWAWRLRDHLRGPLPGVLIECSVLDLPKAFAASTTASSLGSPAFTDRNQLQIWILKTNDLNGVTTQLLNSPKIGLLGRPRIQTGHGVQAALYVGGTVSVDGTPVNTGFRFDTRPLIRSKSVDLSVLFSYTEAVTNRAAPLVSGTPGEAVSVQTNGPVALRIQIGDGNGVFILHDAATNDQGRALAVLIRPSRL
jgi:hypothetical protein